MPNKENPPILLGNRIEFCISCINEKEFNNEVDKWVMYGYTMHQLHKNEILLMKDGNYNIRLKQKEFSSPTLQYVAHSHQLMNIMEHFQKNSIPYNRIFDKYKPNEVYGLIIEKKYLGIRICIRKLEFYEELTDKNNILSIPLIHLNMENVLEHANRWYNLGFSYIKPVISNESSKDSSLEMKDSLISLKLSTRNLDHTTIPSNHILIFDEHWKTISLNIDDLSVSKYKV